MARKITEVDRWVSDHSNAEAKTEADYKCQLYRDLAAAATASGGAIESLARDVSAVAERRVAELVAERKQIPWWYYFERREVRQEIQSWRKLIRSPRATN